VYPVYSGLLLLWPTIEDIVDYGQLNDALNINFIIVTLALFKDYCLYLYDAHIGCRHSVRPTVLNNLFLMGSRAFCHTRYSSCHLEQSTSSANEHRLFRRSPVLSPE